MLRQLAKRHGLSAVQQLRGYAAEAALATESPFLRFGSPLPSVLNMSGLVAQLPETQVGGCSGAGRARGPGRRTQGPLSGGASGPWLRGLGYEVTPRCFLRRAGLLRKGCLSRGQCGG